ncbi:hypothetical protein, partial [Bacteriovorax sp. Seq25_V]|uniref:hypothetical protein n=1 Tax=Bacteriovorax sp. Seq25_V TaxID=1201288 RepID=UPI00038A389F
MNKFLLLLMFSISIFAKTDIPLNNDGASKYFSKDEMEDGSRWVLSFAHLEGDGALSIPSIKFY